MLVKFSKDIIKVGAESFLPAKLDDHWLKSLTEELDQLKADVSKIDVPPMVMAAVALLLFAKEGKNSEKLTCKELWKKMYEYRIELGLETARRSIEIDIKPATLQTIFTKRSVI